MHAALALSGLSPAARINLFMSVIFKFTTSLTSASTAEYWCITGIEKVGRLEHCTVGEYSVPVCKLGGLVHSSNWY